MKNVCFICILLILTTASCNKKHGTPIKNCDETSVMDFELHDKIQTNNYTIINAVIDGNCLKITYGASGYNTGVAQLVGTPVIAAVEPSIVNSKLFVRAETGVFTAYFEKTISFDLIPFQMPGKNRVKIELAKWDASLFYHY